MNETRYAIDCTRNPRYAAYVGKPNASYLSTHWLSQANLWKTRAGAEKWLADRSFYAGTIVAVEMREFRTARGQRRQTPTLVA